MNIVILPLLLITLKEAVNGELICVTDACKKLSKRIKNSLDESVSPCQDFYKFSCGNYLKTTKLEEDQSYTDNFLEVKNSVDAQIKSILEKDFKEDDIKPYKDMKRLYSLCMDEDKMNNEKIDPLKNKIKAIWPVLGQWDTKKFSIINTEITIYNLGLISSSLFDLSVDVDDKDNTKRLLKIDQPELIVYMEYLTGHDEESKKVLEEEENFMVQVAMALGAKEKTARSEMKDVMDFMINMARVMQERYDIKAEEMYNIIKLVDLQKDVDWIVWKDLFNELLPKTIVIGDEERINVTDLKYLKQLGNLLKQYDNKVIANYMIWYAIRNFTDSTTKELREYKRKVDHEEGDKPERWRECVEDVYSRFPLAISSLYVKEYFSLESKYAVRGIIRGLRIFVAERIQQTFSWLPEKTRLMAIAKTYYMRDDVGYPDDLMDDNNLIKYYEGLNLDQKSYFESLVAYQQWFNNLEFKYLRHFYSKDDWRYHGSVAEAYGSFDFTENSMDFRAGFLQLPIYSDQVPKYINFAGIGQIAGNQFTQAFIDKGAEYDANGNLNNWWDEESKKTFKTTKEECFEKQYSGFTCSETNEKIDGTRTLSMNMADNGGLRLAFEVYKQVRGEHGEAKLPDLLEYTPEKMFWIAAANLWCAKAEPETLKEWIKEDAHVPPEFRVNGVVMNSEHFSTTFGCGESQPMNSPKKCTVWS